MSYSPDLFHRITDGGNTAINDFDLEVSRGNVYGISVWELRGRCTTVSTNLIEVWENGTGYRFPTGTLSLSVSSSDAGDAYTGQGAKVLHIDGIGANYEAYSEELWLSGTTLVSSTGSFFRVNHAHVDEAGSHQGNRGTIHIWHGPLLLSYMISGSGHDSNAVYTVSSGNTAYVRSLVCNTGKDTTIRWRVQSKKPGAGWHTIRDIENYRSHQRFDLPYLYEFPSGTDIRVSAVKADVALSDATVTVAVIMTIVNDAAGTR